MLSIKKACLCLAAVLLLSAALTNGALADITSVRSLGDGRTQVQWDDTKTAYLAFTPKMSASFDDDFNDYGFMIFTAGDGQFKNIASLAPDQSYWVVAVSESFSILSRYSYTAPQRVEFSEFRQRPSMSDFGLRRKNAAGNTSKLSSFSKSGLENTLDTMSYGVTFQYNYPQLKNARHYLGQLVLTDPAGEKYVDAIFDEELPAGRTYATVRFYSLNDYFSHLIKARGAIPTGKYNLALCWDGQYVFSSNFTVGQ